MRRRDFVRAAAAGAAPLLAGSNAWADREPRGPAQTPTSVSPAATVALHYVTWLDEEAWSFASTWPILDPKDPVPRRYRSDDPEVMRRHNAQATHHGFVWLWSWWGRGAVLGGDGVLQRYLDEDPASAVQLMILYEGGGILSADRDGFFSFDTARNSRLFVEDMAHLERAYFSNPRYAHRFFRIEGRPVVFVWVSRNFIGAWPEAVASARGEASFYLVGSEFGLGLSEDGRTALVRSNLAEATAPLDAVSGYGIYERAFVPPSGRLDAAYTARYAAAIRSWAEILLGVAPHAKFIPPLQFAYDDHYYRPEARNPSLVSDTQESLEVARATRALLDDARAGDPRYRNVLPIVLVVSWNEHIEGTAIEWTVEHGSRYLQTVASTFRG